MGYPLINGAVINGEESSPSSGIDLALAGRGRVALTLLGVGANALEMGAPAGQIGVDVAGRPPGIELAWGGLHVTSVGQPPADFVLMGVGARALELGDPQVVLGTVVLGGVSSRALDLGDHGLERTLLGKGAHALDVGAPENLSIVLQGLGAHALEPGSAAASFLAAALGIDLASAGVGRLVVSGVTLRGAGAVGLELGTPGLPGAALFGRQTFAMELGHPSVDRGRAC